MSFKWIGAMLIVAGCGGFGFALAASHKREMELLRHMIHALNYMECELQYSLTPLPQLCRKVGNTIKGSIRAIFLQLSEEMERQLSPDVQSCMNAVLALREDLSPQLKDILRDLGICLGRFDLPGQLQGLESVRRTCTKQLEYIGKDADTRFRSYQTLGLCAGAALAILFV